jgi:hypothetical protein
MVGKGIEIVMTALGRRVRVVQTHRYLFLIRGIS